MLKSDVMWQDTNISEDLAASSSPFYSETLKSYHITKQHHNPEDHRNLSHITSKFNMATMFVTDVTQV
jgi:hypothetical protein